MMFLLYNVTFPRVMKGVVETIFGGMEAHCDAADDRIVAEDTPQARPHPAACC